MKPVGTIGRRRGRRLIGSRFGQGGGKAAAIVGGALIGGFLGNSVGPQPGR